MSEERLLRWLALPETEKVLNLLAQRIAEGVMSGLEKSGLLGKLLEQVEKAQAGAAPPSQVKPAEPVKLPPIPLSPEVALSLLKEQAAKRESSQLRKPGIKRTFVKPTVTYRTDPRKCSETPLASESAVAGPAAAFGGLKVAAGYPLPPPPPRAAPPKKEGTRAVFALLYEDKGRKTLFGFINQVRFGRSDLADRVNEYYKGLPGVPVSEEDIMRAIHYHKLVDVLHKREDEIICRHLRKEKGSLTKTAQKMKMAPEKLNERIQELRIDGTVAAIRQEFCEQIMEQFDLRQKLELALTKSKYLADLNIEQQLDTAIKEEIKGKLAQYANLTELERQQAICQDFGLDQELYKRLSRRYGLEDRPPGNEQVSAQNAP